MKKSIFITMLLLCVMVILADGTPPEGSGTESDPYLVSELDNLLWLSTTETIWGNSYYFMQTENIDASETENWNEGAGFSPIGLAYDLPFTGNYNGNNCTIDNLFIYRPGIECVGFFGYTSGSNIDSLGITNLNIRGGSRVGGLTGLSENTIITRCYTSGTIFAGNNSGGLTGRISEGEIDNCFSNCDVSCYFYCGGLTGTAYYSSIDNCYSTGDITGGNFYNGGMIGCSYTSSVSNSYSTGIVEGEDIFGGFAGKINLGSQIDNCIWNTETSGQLTGIGLNEGDVTNLLGKTLAEMQLTSTFTDIGWDFTEETVNGTEDFWKNNSDVNTGFPYLTLMESSFCDITANFTAAPLWGGIPLAVNFSDESESEFSITAWEWDFNNDNVIDSYEQNPEWVYDQEGIFTISLTVYDGISRESSTLVKDSYINVYCGDIPPEGEGTENNPYIIESLGNLQWISSNVNSWNSHFLQTEDINAVNTTFWNDGAGFIPIGINDSLSFQGSYDGGNHAISCLSINRGEQNCIGLFGCISDAVISNLGVTLGSITGNENVGALVGKSSNSSTVNQCFSTCSVTGSMAGGLIGFNDNSTVCHCYCDCFVMGGISGGLVGRNYYSNVNFCYALGSVDGNYNNGGLVGENAYDSHIENCYADVNVGGYNYSGGLAGAVHNNSSVSNCYSISNVSSMFQVGGITGLCTNSTISQSYAAGEVTGEYQTGIFAGLAEYAQISDCIWKRNETGVTDSIGFAYETPVNGFFGLNNEEMQILSYYTAIGWDFSGEVVNGSEDTWSINSVLNSGYPYITQLENSLYENLIANFYAPEIISHAPFTVEFFDYSLSQSNLITSWEWDFQNDGVIDSNEQNPVWTYNVPGVYSISLSVYDLQGETDTEVKLDYITVLYAGIEPEGSGTLLDPYHIESIDNLLWISENQNSWSSYFVQTANIDAQETASWNDGCGFSPIGLDAESPFQGSYEGNHYDISNLYINRPEQGFVGFFGYTEEAVIRNMGFIDSYILGRQRTGGIAGSAHNSTFSGCYSIARVIGDDHAGGLIGYSEYSELSTSYTEGGVSGNDYIGGLMGYARNSFINDSYAVLSVGGESFVGGIIGFNIESLVNNCYSTGFVSANQTFGGLIGFNTYDINNCIWNMETSGQLEGLGYNDGGIINNMMGASTQEMQSITTYTDFGWDFLGESINGDEDIWGIDSLFNDGYPYITVIDTPVDNNQVLDLASNFTIFPNPFNPRTILHFELKQRSFVEINIYNLKGQRIETLAKQYYEPAKHSLSWNAEKYSSGVYLVSMRFADTVNTKKITLLK